MAIEMCLSSPSSLFKLKLLRVTGSAFTSRHIYHSVLKSTSFNCMSNKYLIFINKRIATQNAMPFYKEGIIEPFSLLWKKQAVSSYKKKVTFLLHLELVFCKKIRTVIETLHEFLECFFLHLSPDASPFILRAWSNAANCKKTTKVN